MADGHKCDPDCLMCRVRDLHRRMRHCFTAQGLSDAERASLKRDGDTVALLYLFVHQMHDALSSSAIAAQMMQGMLEGIVRSEPGNSAITVTEQRIAAAERMLSEHNQVLTAGSVDPRLNETAGNA